MARLSRLQIAAKVSRREILIGEEAIRAGGIRGPGYQRYKSAHDLIAALRQSIYVKFQAQMIERELAEPGEPATSKIEPWPYEW